VWLELGLVLDARFYDRRFLLACKIFYMCCYISDSSEKKVSHKPNSDQVSAVVFVQVFP